MTTLGPGPEFEKIRNMIAHVGHDSASIGDDCAVLRQSTGEYLLVSTDTSVENVHFKRGWMTFEEMGYRATAAALSDIAAMGGSPIGVVAAYGVPARDSRSLEDLALGAGAAALASGTSVVGGDISVSATLTITATVLGTTRHPLRRSGARGGDIVYSTGTFGGPLHALTAFSSGKSPANAERDRFVRPVPRISEALWLAERGATSCIDISDGLAGDLVHLAAASRVSLVISPGNIPLFEGVTVEEALMSGEEYELCVTMPAEVDAAEFRELFGIPLSKIGAVLQSSNPQVTFDTIASSHSLRTYNHFV